MISINTGILDVASSDESNSSFYHRVSDKALLGNAFANTKLQFTTFCLDNQVHFMHFKE